MGSGRHLLLCFISVLAIASTAQSFNCSSSDTTCDALIDYVSPNRTTLSAIKNLFGVKNLRSILGANNLPLSTSPNETVSAKQKIKIPFKCLCRNGTGISYGRPVYKVVPGDGLYHIAAEVFSRLVTYQQIQAVNNISNPDLIEVGQELRIPLPCNCDELEREKVVHYGHVVDNGSSVEGIAQEFNTTGDTLLRLNGLASPSDLQAGAVLDVPLKACTSMISNDSLDYPLLVPNGTYVFTATNCVMCSCSATDNWMLECKPSQLNSSKWTTCPSMQCAGAENLYLGNTSSSGCTTCAYAGYYNQTVNTTIALESTCPASGADSGATKFSMQGQSWNLLLICIHSVMLCLHLSQ